MPLVYRTHGSVAARLAFSGRKKPSLQHRNAYQEILHAPLFAAVPTFSSPVESTADLPRLLRHAWRTALAETPRPTHLDVNGVQGEVIELGQTHVSTTIETEARGIPIHCPLADARDIERAAALLSGARRVAIVTGNGAAMSEAGPDIRFGPTDFAAVVRSFGVRGIRVEQPGEIAAALQQAIAANGAVVVDVVTPLEPRAPAPWTPPR